MKKSILLFVIAALIIVTTGIWFFTSEKPIAKTELMQIGIIVIVIAFAIYIGVRRMDSVRRGEPADDELSKNIMKRTAGLSYYISLYMWLGIMYFSDRIKLETHSIIGIGILGMAIVFAGCWVFFNFIGTKNE